MPVISVDFDGTLIEDGHWPGIGPEIPGAVEAVNTLFNAGFCIIINSCRAREAEETMIQWLEDHNVSYSHVNENCQERVIYYRTDCRKISADCYVDDKNLLMFDFRKPETWEDIKNLLILKYGETHKRGCE
jgi:hypothetical protein